MRMLTPMLVVFAVAVSTADAEGGDLFAERSHLFLSADEDAAADAPLPPKDRIIQKMLADLNITVSDETIGVIQRCVLDQTMDMLVASDIKFLTFRVTDDEPYYEMLPPNLFNKTELAHHFMDALNNSKFTMNNWQACSVIPNAKYCMFFAFPSFTLSSMCVPDTCTRADLDAFQELSPMLRVYTSEDILVYEDDEGAKTTAGIFSTIAAVAVVCTLLSMGADFLVELREEKLEQKRLSGEADPLLADDDAGNLQLPTNVAAKKETEDVVLSPFWRFMACWDVRAALDDLFRISPKRPTNFLNGMRVFSIMWVILGHCLAYPMQPGTDNLGDVANRLVSYRFIFVSSGVYAVDTFFYMSGFLATYLLLKSFPKDIAAFTASTRVLLIYADRYIRLTPFYALCILFAYNLLEYLCDRPGAVLYTHGGSIGYKCDENWWRNLLYINNLDIDHMTCMGHTWYLANDMQFFIMSIPMIVMHKMAPSQMWKLLTVIPPLLCLLVSILLASTIANSRMSAGNGGDSYFYPYVRAAPYFYGVLTGFMLYDESVSSAVKRAVKGRLCRWALYLFCAVAMWGCLSFQWAALRAGTGDVGYWGYPVQSLKQFVYHFFWGLCLGILTLIWTAGHGGRVVSFLSLPAFEPLGRVTYGVYLIHPMVYAVMRTGLLSGLVHYTDTWLIGFTVLCGCGSYLAGMIAFVFIERPVGAMWDLVSGRKKRRAVK